MEVVPVTRPTSQPQCKSKFANAIWPSVTMKSAIWIWTKKMKLIHMITNPSLHCIVRNAEGEIRGAIFAKPSTIQMIWKSRGRKVVKAPNTSGEIVMLKMEIWVLNGNGDACLSTPLSLVNMKLSVKNVIFVDTSVWWIFSLTAKDCLAVPHKALTDSVGNSDCQSLDDSDYEVQCTCHGSGCNLRDDYEELETITPDPILEEVNRSIRQLRADLQRTIRRYARNWINRKHQFQKTN